MSISGRVWYGRQDRDGRGRRSPPLLGFQMGPGPSLGSCVARGRRVQEGCDGIGGTIEGVSRPCLRSLIEV